MPTLCTARAYKVGLSAQQHEAKSSKVGMARTYLAGTKGYSDVRLTCNGYRVTACRSRRIQHHCQPSHQLYTGQPPAEELIAVEVAVVSHEHSMLTMAAPQLPGVAAITPRSQVALQLCMGLLPGVIMLLFSSETTRYRLDCFSASSSGCSCTRYQA